MDETMTIPQWMDGVSEILNSNSAALQRLAELRQDPNPPAHPERDHSTTGTQTISYDDLIAAAKENQIVNPKGDQVPLDQVLAEMEALSVRSYVGQLDRMFQGLPAGSALVGGGFGLLANEIIDGFVAPTPGSLSPTNALAKVATAWASAHFLPTYVGKTAGTVSAAVLLLDVIRSALPLDQWIAWLKAKISGIGGFSQQNQLMGYSNNSSYVNQLPSAPQGQIISGRGGSGYDSLAGVFQ